MDVILVDALITIAAGSFLYWHDWHLLPSVGDWIGSRFGATLTAGALLAISVTRSLRSSHAPRSAGSGPWGDRPPRPAAPRPAQIAAAQRRLAVAERTSLTLAVLAVVAMALARYV